MRELTSKSWRLPTILLSALAVGASATGIAQAVSSHPAGAGIHGPSGGASNPERTTASSTPCFVSATECESTDPMVTLGMRSAGNTTSCSFQEHIDWGDKTKAQTFTFPGGQDGATLVTMRHAYRKSGGYSITATGTVPVGTCYNNPFTLKFTLARAYQFILPHKNVTLGMLKKKHHDYPAIDIAVPTGTPYYAITSGKVAYSSQSKQGKACGTGILLYGIDGVLYTYCHGSKRIATANAYVTAGQELGLTGNTASEGHSAGPHLHFQVNSPVKRCPQLLLEDLFNGTVPLPNPSTLPTTGCF